MTITENKKGELFDNNGECVWPTISHPVDRKFYLDSFKNNSNEWCRGNKKSNAKHRVIFILSSSDEDGNTYCERQCFDCGKKIILGFERIPTGVN